MGFAILPQVWVRAEIGQRLQKSAGAGKILPPLPGRRQTAAGNTDPFPTDICIHAWSVLSSSSSTMT